MSAEVNMKKNKSSIICYLTAVAVNVIYGTLMFVYNFMALVELGIIENGSAKPGGNVPLAIGFLAGIAVGCVVINIVMYMIMRNRVGDKTKLKCLQAITAASPYLCITLFALA